MLKTEYEVPEVQIIILEKNDIICTSGCGGTGVETGEDIIG